MLQYHMKDHGFQVNAEYGELQVSGQGEYGYRPYELMVTAIVGCSSLTFKKILEKMRIIFTDIHVTADIERNSDIANRIEKIHLTFIVSSTNATEKELEKVLKLANKNCSMIQSVKNSITMTESIVKT
ncbi:OsmC family protein [Amphibacillus sp. Q70]|uniref:OsmC family protein n=1 Tax=Amphibacillus sp. Q70 TaxID=3453416 RepID=UPI003F826628